MAHRPLVTSHPSQPVPELATSALAFASMAGERGAVGARWVASRLLLLGGVLGSHAARAGRAGWSWTAHNAVPGARAAVREGAPAAQARLRRTPAWIVHCLVMLAGVWLLAMSGLTTLRATLGPESGAGVLSASFPALLAMLLAAAAVLLSLHRMAHSSRNASQAVLLVTAVVALALG